MYIEYIKNGLNKSIDVDNSEEAEIFVKANNLIKVSDPENENEYRIVS